MALQLEHTPKVERQTTERLEAVYRFVKEGGLWYIDLPEYLAQGGRKADLLMVEGADDLLDFMADERKSISMELDTVPFDGADVMDLLELCQAPKGGGYYILHTYQQQVLQKKLWLCDVTLFVFGDMPERIYVKKVQPHIGQSA